MVRISALVLSEDGSKFAFETIRNICRETFDLVVPRCAVHDCVDFRPSSDREREAMTANGWKSTKSRDQPRFFNLCKSIASHLLRDDGFVFFHFDGDTLWSARDHSENLVKFEERVVRKVREFVRGHVEKTRKADPEAFIDHTMRKLIHVAPFYSIESWLFANIEMLRSLCSGKDLPVEVTQRLDAWQRDLGEMDRTKPKGLVPVSTKDYPQLASELKSAALMALDTSFCDTVLRMGNCSPLIVRLRSSWPSYVRQQYGLD